MSLHALTDPPSSVLPGDGIEYVADREIAEIGARLLGDAYIAWIRAQRDAQEALEAWLEAAARSRALAYGAYAAAVEREDAAAYDLQRVWEHTRPCLALLLAAIQAVAENPVGELAAR